MQWFILTVINTFPIWVCLPLLQNLSQQVITEWVTGWLWTSHNISGVKRTHLRAKEVRQQAPDHGIFYWIIKVLKLSTAHWTSTHRVLNRTWSVILSEDPFSHYPCPSQSAFPTHPSDFRCPLPNTVKGSIVIISPFFSYLRLLSRNLALVL